MHSNAASVFHLSCCCAELKHEVGFKASLSNGRTESKQLRGMAGNAVDGQQVGKFEFALGIPQ